MFCTDILSNLSAQRNKQQALSVHLNFELSQQLGFSLFPILNLKKYK